MTPLRRCLACLVVAVSAITFCLCVLPLEHVQWH